MSKIVCNIQAGVLKHEVAIVKDVTVERFELALNQIPNFIIQHSDVKDVYLHGLNYSFLEKIEQDTQKLEQNLYSHNTKKFHYI